MAERYSRTLLGEIFDAISGGINNRNPDGYSRTNRQKPVKPVSPTEAVLDSSGRDDQGADLDMDAIKRLAAEFDKPAPPNDLKPPVRSDDANSSDSALTSMRQQYAPGADIWSTDEGKAILEAARTNSYGGDAAGLAQFNTQQRQAGIGANPEIIEALGYEKGSPMETWAKANPALAMREYNKKFGNSYEGEGSGDANSVLANGMTAGADQAAAIKNAAAIMGGTGRITESNNQKTSELQNPEAQSIPGLNGMNTLRETMRKHFQNAAEAERLF